MHHAIPVLATGALAFICGAALAGVDPAAPEDAPLAVPSVSSRSPAAPPQAAPSTDRCRVVVAHIDGLIARAAGSRSLLLPEARADACAGATMPETHVACILDTDTPEMLAECLLVSLDSPSRRVYSEMTKLLSGNDQSAVDVERLARATAAMVDELGGDGARAGRMVVEALSAPENDDAAP